MKNANIGLILVLSSAIIYGSVLISASIYSEVLVREGQGWNSQHGIFGTAIREVGTVPIIISVLVALAGLFLIMKSREKD